MKKQVHIILEVDSDDPLMLSDEFIKGDLISELSCASNHYNIISMIIQCPPSLRTDGERQHFAECDAKGNDFK